jgi:von Willebrand factor type A domain/Winged helix-turn-helix DNA-binding
LISFTEEEETMSDVNALDLAFVVDTTGSMGAFIQAAQSQMIAMIDALATGHEVDLRLAVVEYRDHPPQDQMVYRVHPFREDRKAVQKTINGLQPDGGGDGPESVFDGVLAACRELAWRPHARRLAVLVGDAPPHGVGGSGDGFPKGCPCGETIESVTAAAEEAGVTMYALGLTSQVRDSFGRLSQFTGGEYFESGQGAAAIDRLQVLLQAEFGHLDFDRKLLALRREAPELSLDGLAERLGSSRPAVSSAVSRLGARGLLV